MKDAILCSVRITMWRGNLWLVGHETIRPVVAAAEFIRKQHNSLCRQWDEGRRLLPVALIETHRWRMERAIDLFNKAVAEFTAVFKDKWSHDKTVADSVDGRFSVKIVYEPIPTSHHLPGGATGGWLGLQIDAQTGALMREGQTALYGRVLDVVDDLTAKLRNRSERLVLGKRSLWRETTLDGLTELLEYLPHLNLEDDPLLVEVEKKLAFGVAKYMPFELRDDSAIRAAAIMALNDVALYLIARITTRETMKEGEL